MKNLLLTLLISGFSLVAHADVRLPSLFADHMILQQETRNAIWGFADAGENITVAASWGAEEKTSADKNGKWKIFLKTPEYGTGHSITVKSTNTITIQDVAIGEVWLCAGQSNMGFSLGQIFGGEEEAATADSPNFRIFKSSREHWHEPLDESRDRLAKWKPCHSESAASTSAVSYYFGKKLHEELGIPVGIIVQAYAGTPIEGWMPWAIQKNDPRTQAHKNELDETNVRQTGRLGFTADKALTTYKIDLKKYNALIDSGETMKNQARQLAPPTIVKPAAFGHQYPGHVFNARRA